MSNVILPACAPGILREAGKAPSPFSRSPPPLSRSAGGFEKIFDAFGINFGGFNKTVAVSAGKLNEFFRRRRGGVKFLAVYERHDGVVFAVYDEHGSFHLQQIIQRAVFVSQKKSHRDERMSFGRNILNGGESRLKEKRAGLVLFGQPRGYGPTERSAGDDYF